MQYIFSLIYYKNTYRIREFVPPIDCVPILSDLMMSIESITSCGKQVSMEHNSSTLRLQGQQVRSSSQGLGIRGNYALPAEGKKA